MLEVLQAVAGAVGAERTGIRLSPYNSFLSASDDSVEKSIEKNVWLMKEMDKRVPNLAYIHMVSCGWGGVICGFEFRVLQPQASLCRQPCLHTCICSGNAACRLSPGWLVAMLSVITPMYTLCKGIMQ
jgi:2,4-dienoyl-CoA reductase-like NADH-dependent reductase (Old Yellow Enzyme family)